MQQSDIPAPFRHRLSIEQAEAIAKAADVDPPPLAEATPAYNEEKNQIDVGLRARTSFVDTRWFFTPMDGNAKPLTAQLIATLPAAQFSKPETFQGGKTQAAKEFAAIAAVISPYGTMYAETEKHMKPLIGKAKGAITNLLKKTKLSADAEVGTKAGGRCTYAPKQPFKHFTKINEETGEEEDFVQLLVSVPLFYEDPKVTAGSAEHEANLQKFKAGGALFEYASNNPTHVPNMRFKVQCAMTKEEVPWYVAFYEHSHFGSCRMYASIEIFARDLRPLYERNRFILQLYLDKVEAVCFIGSATSTGKRKAESLATDEQRAKMQRMFAVATGETFDEEEDVEEEEE